MGAVLQEKPELLNFLTKKRNYNFSDGIDFETLLNLPLQRPRIYMNTMDTIFKNIPSSHQDYTNMKDALFGLNEFYQQFRMQIAKINNYYRITELSRKWKKDDLLTKPTIRYLIREGKLKISPSKEISTIKQDLYNIKDVSVEKLRSGIENFKDIFNKDMNIISNTAYNIFDVRFMEGIVNVYLFEDMMFIEETSVTLFVNRLVGGKALSHVNMKNADVESSSENPNSFIVSADGKALTFIAEDEKSKQTWINDIFMVIKRLEISADEASSSSSSSSSSTGLSNPLLPDTAIKTDFGPDDVCR